MSKRKCYDHEFKVQAVKLALEIGQAKTCNELKLPENSAVLAVASDDKFIFHPAEYKLKENDKLIVYVSPADIRAIERIFYR